MHCLWQNCAMMVRTKVLSVDVSTQGNSIYHQLEDTRSMIRNQCHFVYTSRVFRRNVKKVLNRFQQSIQQKIFESFMFSSERSSSAEYCWIKILAFSNSALQARYIECNSYTFRKLQTNNMEQSYVIQKIQKCGSKKKE